MCIMSLVCWKTLGFPLINQSLVILKAFDGRGYRLFLILRDLPLVVEGKNVTLEVEVIDAPLNYNLLLCWSWSYAMIVVVSSFFQLIVFTHKENMVEFEHFSY